MKIDKLSADPTPAILYGARGNKSWVIESLRQALQGPTKPVELVEPFIIFDECSTLKKVEAVKASRLLSALLKRL